MLDLRGPDAAKLIEFKPEQVAMREGMADGGGFAAMKNGERSPF